ncbi:MAG: pitrilysin family protein, partial [Hyphomicrobiaceae bacterium]
MIGAIATYSRAAHAMKIQEVTSPGGIKAWLVEQHSVPLITMRFAFDGGSAQDPAGKEGLANFLTVMMDEGAGDLDARSFQERMEEIAMKMSFEDDPDHLYGTFQTLTANRAEAVALLKLALASPRFDADAVERLQRQLLASLAFAAKDPNQVAGKAFTHALFPGHPYGRPSSGTPESVATITRDDLLGYKRKVFARDTLKVAVVGDIDATSLGKLLDEVFGALPANADLVPVPRIEPRSDGAIDVRQLPVPQSVAMFGLPGLPRKHPDFMTAFVLNHILGGGGFASRLMTEVREKRGLAYSVYSYLQTFQHSALFAGGVATKNEEIGRSLDVIRGELKRLADEGPSAEELAAAKSYLTGSYALRF